MDKNGDDRSKNAEEFVTPKQTRTKKRGVQPLLLLNNDTSESEIVMDSQIGNSPRRGRPPGSKTGSVSQYIPRSTKSRQSSSDSRISTDNETLQTNTRSRRFISSSESENDALHMSTRKRCKRASNSSSQLDSSENEGFSGAEEESNLTLQTPKETAVGGLAKKKTARNKKRISNGPAKENSNAPSTSSKTNSTASPTSGVAAKNSKKSYPKTKRSRVSKKLVVENTIQPTVILRQNGKAVLVAIDNTEEVNSPAHPPKNPRKALINTATISPTNIWQPSQALEVHHGGQVPNSPAVPSPPEESTILIVNNRLFRCDSEVPNEIQNISEDRCVLRCGAVLNKERLMSHSPGLEFEEISRLPMKVSSFFSLYGLYFGHKKLAGANGKKITRKGFTETRISNSFYVYCRLCSKLKACTGGSLANFGRHLKDAHDRVDPAKLNLGVMSVDENGEVSHGHSERYTWDNPRQALGMDLLLQYMMDSNLPFRNIEKFSLKRLLNFFDPQFILPSAMTLHGLLAKRVETEVIAGLKKTLQNVDSATLVVDAWSSRNMQGVLAVSAVFLDNEFNWKQKTISISRITGSHTAFNIGQKIKAAIKRWNLGGKIRFVVSDGGSNMVKSLADLHEETARENLVNSAEVQNSPERSLDIVVNMSEHALTTVDVSSQSSSPEVSIHSPAKNTTDSILQEVPIEDCVDTAGSGPNAPDFFTNDFFGIAENIATFIHEESDQTKTKELSKLDYFLYTENVKPSKCIAHTLQRVLAVGMNRNGKAMKIHKQIKKIAAFGRKRQVARDITKALRGRVVIRPGLTRWNSIVDSGWTLVEPVMFSIMRDLIDDARNKSSAKMRERLPDALTDEFALELQEFLQVSDPICKLTDELQGNGITAHLAIPGIARTYEAINKMTSLKAMEDYRRIILESFESKMFQFVNDKDFIFATVLCPYYKLAFFEVYFEDQPFNALQIPSLDTVKEWCFTHLQTAEEMEASFTSQRSQMSVNLSTSCSYAQKIQERENKRRERIDSTKSDLQKYLSDELCGDSPNEYWKRKKSDFPRLYDKAREILCKPATSGLVERLFSLIADINTADRVNLNVKTIEEIVMYKEFINLPKTYKEAVQNVFNATDEQLIQLVEKLSIQNNTKVSSRNPKSTLHPKSKRSSENAPSTSSTMIK